MKYYIMTRKVSENSTLLDQLSHELIEFSTGNLFPTHFEGELITELDSDFINGVMPTFYTDPAVIGTKKFYQDLIELGVDNIEVKGAVIQDNVNNKIINDYLLLNILGRISCANMEKSEYSNLGDELNIIDKLVINPNKTHGQELFLVHEDTDCIVISERIFDGLSKKGYPDIYFEELELTI